MTIRKGQLQSGRTFAFQQMQSTPRCRGKNPGILTSLENFSVPASSLSPFSSGATACQTRSNIAIAKEASMYKFLCVPSSTHVGLSWMSNSAFSPTQSKYFLLHQDRVLYRTLVLPSMRTHLKIKFTQPEIRAVMKEWQQGTWCFTITFSLLLCFILFWALKIRQTIQSAAVKYFFAFTHHQPINIGNF